MQFAKCKNLKTYQLTENFVSLLQNYCTRLLLKEEFFRVVETQNIIVSVLFNLDIICSNGLKMKCLKAKKCWDVSAISVNYDKNLNSSVPKNYIGENWALFLEFWYCSIDLRFWKFEIFAKHSKTLFVKIEQWYKLHFQTPSCLFFYFRCDPECLKLEYFSAIKLSIDPQLFFEVFKHFSTCNQIIRKTLWFIHINLNETNGAFEKYIFGNCVLLLD